MVFVQFFVAALVIIYAGSFLAKNSDRIAELTGWGRLFVGSLLLAGATSLPELMVDIHAVKNHLPDLAVGDLLGSSLFNLLILALLDLAYPSTFRGTSFSPRFQHHALPAVFTIIMTSVIGAGIAAKYNLAFFEVGHFAWTALVVYFYGLRLTFIESKMESLEVRSHKLTGPQKRDLFFSFLGYCVSALVILIAAPFLVDSADKIATDSGIGHTFVGTTLVALSTSLPEFVASLAAFRIGAPDMALGNIFGSNAFNMVLFVPLDFFYKGSLFSVVQNVHAVTAFGVVMATGVAVMGQLYGKKERIRVPWSGSASVVFVILVLLVLLFQLKQ